VIGEPSRHPAGCEARSWNIGQPVEIAGPGLNSELNLRTKLNWALVWLPLAVGCGEGSGQFVRPHDPVVTLDAAPEAEIEIVPVGPPMTGLHVVGNRIQNAEGLDVVLHGVNRSGTEYQCAKNVGFFDGPADLASVAAMAT